MADVCPKCKRPQMIIGGPCPPGPYCNCWVLDSESMGSYDGGTVPVSVALAKVQELRRQLAAANGTIRRLRDIVANLCAELESGPDPRDRAIAREAAKGGEGE